MRLSHRIVHGKCRLCIICNIYLENNACKFLFNGHFFGGSHTPSLVPQTLSCLLFSSLLSLFSCLLLKCRLKKMINSQLKLMEINALINMSDV